MYKRKGFTLIELLVIISIVGLLSSMAFYAFNSARLEARDTKRKADLRQTSVALELYFDNQARYPSERHCDSSAGSCDSHCTSCILGDNWDEGPSNSYIYQGLIPNYMSTLPIDPINDVAQGYIYTYEPSNYRKDYCLSAKLEAGGYFDIRGGEGPWSCRHY